MSKTILTFCSVVLFLQAPLISAQSNANSNRKNDNSNPASVQTSPTVSPANTVPANPQPTTVPPKTESVVSRIPNDNSYAEITFLGTDETDKNKLTLKVRYKDDASPIPQKKTFLVSDSQLKSVLSKFREGDLVSLEYTKEKDSDTLKDIEVKSVKTDSGFPLLPALFIILFPLIGLLLGHKLFLGEDNRYSTSKFQIVIWFFVLIAIYFVVNTLRVCYGDWSFVGGVGIPTNLLLLAGLSSITFVGAKAITDNKLAENPNAKSRADKPNFPSDLFRSDNFTPTEKTIMVDKLDADGKPMLDANGTPIKEEKKEIVLVKNVDLGDFQMVIITLLAVVVYVVQVISFIGTVELHQFITLPDVDSTILTAFGLGQGAYLVKKYASE